jgi:hypothetical protein
MVLVFQFLFIFRDLAPSMTAGFLVLEDAVRLEIIVYSFSCDIGLSRLE